MTWNPACNQCKRTVTRDEAKEEGRWLEAHINIRPFGNSQIFPRNLLFCSGQCGAQYLRILAEQVHVTGGSFEMTAR